MYGVSFQNDLMNVLGTLEQLGRFWLYQPAFISAARLHSKLTRPG